MIAVDTNLLLYAHDPADATKQAIAIDLIASLSEAVLLWQVACEFVNAVRKLNDPQFGPVEALGEVQALARFWPLCLPSAGCLPRAVELVTAHSLSFWDAILIAASEEAGVTQLYTEDMKSGERYGTVTVRNPFR